MAADIFFDKNHAWAVSSAAFDWVLEYAIEQCSSEEALLADLFAFAVDMKCLNIARYKELELRVALTEKLRDVGRSFARELETRPEIQVSEVNMVWKLVSLAEEHLIRLRNEAGARGQQRLDRFDPAG